MYLIFCISFGSHENDFQFRLYHLINRDTLLSPKLKYSALLKLKSIGICESGLVLLGIGSKWNFVVSPTHKDNLFGSISQAHISVHKYDILNLLRSFHSVAP